MIKNFLINNYIKNYLTIRNMDKETFLNLTKEALKKYKDGTKNNPTSGFLFSFLIKTFEVYLWFGCTEELSMGFYILVDPYNSVESHRHYKVSSIEKVQEILKQLYIDLGTDEEEEKGKKLQYIDKMYQRHGEECSICFEPLLNDQKTVTTPCDHIFHVVCYRNIRDNKCPLCRSLI